MLWYSNYSYTNKGIAVMATRNVKIQLPCTPETLALLKDLSHERRTPLNHLIVNADPLVMEILRDDLEARTRHNATKQRN